MAQNIARLGVVLGIDTAEFTKGIEAAKKKLSDIGTFATRAGAVAAAAFTAMTVKALQFSDQMSDLSDATGLSIAKVLQISNAMQRAGGEFGDGSKALIKFSQSIDAAANGSQEMQNSFAKVGVTLQDLATLTEEELINKTSKGIAAIGDKATQTGLKMDFFGKALRTVDMNTFNQYLQQSSEEFKKYEDAIKEAAKLTDKLEQNANKFSLTFIEKVIPSLNLFFETITDKGSSSFAVFEKIFEFIGSTIRNLALGIEGLSAAFRVFGINTKMFLGTMSKDEGWKEIVNIENALNKSIDRVRDFGKEVKKVEPPIPAERPKRKIEASAEAKKQDEMLRVAGLISDEYKRQQEYSLQQLSIREQMVGMTEDERRIQEAINQVTTETSRKIDEITKKREDAAGRGANEKVLAEYDKQIFKVMEMEEAFVASARNIATTSIASQRTFEFGWDKAFNQFAENAYNYAHVAEQAFKSITDNMLSALDNFVDTGKFKFSDFASSVIKDLIKIQLRAQATQLMSKFIGGFGGLLGGIMGGGSSGGWQQSSTGLMVLPGQAAGGYSEANEPRIIGENGPELFIPQRSGTVIPNQQMSSAMQQQPQVVYNGPYIANMSAIDTQSAVQFLAKNKNAVWSANQSASRGLPASRS